MPNHVVNEVIFRGVDRTAQRRLLDKLISADLKVDFEILLPLPLNIWWGSVGAEHMQAFGDSALDWCRRNWGTKWNAYRQCAPAATDDTLTLVFQTVWRPPYGWLVAIFNHFKVSFDHNWLDEGARSGRSGRFDWPSPGIDLGMHEGWRESPADDAMQRHLHFLMWGVESFEDEGAA